MGWAEIELVAKLELDGLNIILSEHIELYVCNLEFLYYREIFGKKPLWENLSGLLSRNRSSRD